MYTSLVDLSKSICSKIVEMDPRFQDYPTERIEKPERICDLEIKETVLIFGANPSSHDLSNQKQKMNTFLKHIPFEVDSKREKRLRAKGYIYPLYFKKNYELVGDLGYDMLWQHPQYLERYRDTLDDDDYKFLLSRTTDSGRYVVFSDLMFLKETSYKNVKHYFKEFREDIFNLFKMQLEYYGPDIVIVTNAAASNFLYEKINGSAELKNGLSTHLDYDGVSIVFSSMVTGARSLDNYNYQRLKREINEIVAKR